MRYLFAMLAVALAVSTATAQTLMEFDVAGALNNPGFLTPSNLAGNVSASNLTRGPGLDPDSFWDGTNSLLLANNFTNAATPDVDDYFQFSVTPTGGVGINYSSLTYALFRENAGLGGTTFVGPGSWQLQYSLDGFASAGTVLDNLSVPVGGAFSLNQVTFTTDISSIGLQAGTVTFRFFGFDRTGSDAFSAGGFGNGTGAIVATGGNWEGTGSDVILTGTIAAVPEPATIGLIVISAGAGGVYFLRRRRQLAQQMQARLKVK